MSDPLPALIHELLEHPLWEDLAGKYGEDAVRRLRRLLRARGTPADDLILYCDGGSKGNPGPAGGGGEIVDRGGVQVASFSVYFGRATNNVAEYKALIEGLDRISALGCRRVEIRLDSELLVKQVRGEYKVKSPHLAPLHAEVLSRLRPLSWTIRHVPREQNSVADALANRAIAEGR